MAGHRSLVSVYVPVVPKRPLLLSGLQLARHFANRIRGELLGAGGLARRGGKREAMCLGSQRYLVEGTPDLLSCHLRQSPLQAAMLLLNTQLQLAVPTHEILSVEKELEMP